MVEGALGRSRPGRKFTVAVMAGIAAHSAGVKAAVAGAGARALSTKLLVGAGTAGGSIGGLVGAILGLSGGWLGSWASAQAAPTVRERELYTRSGRRMFWVSIGFLLILLAMIRTLGGRPSYLVAWAVLFAAFAAYVVVECAVLSRRIHRKPAHGEPLDILNETALRAGWTAIAQRLGTFVYRSEGTLLGLPLLDVNLGAMMPPQAAGPPRSGESDIVSGPRVARGWIAIGDDARGILLAIGSSACGLIAVGGRALGAVSFGGIALGIVGIGGLGAVLLRSAAAPSAGRPPGVSRSAGISRAEAARLPGIQPPAGRPWPVIMPSAASRARHANDREALAAIRNQPLLALVSRRLARQANAALDGPGDCAGQNGGLGQARRAGTIHPGKRPDRDRATNPRSREHRAPRALPDRRRSRPCGQLRACSPGRASVRHGRRRQRRPERHRTSSSGIARAATAQTGDRYTVFATVFPKKDLDKELIEAAARMGDLRISSADLDREKPRLLEELSNMSGRIPALGAVNIARADPPDAGRGEEGRITRTRGDDHARSGPRSLGALLQASKRYDCRGRRCGRTGRAQPRSSAVWQARAGEKITTAGEPAHPWPVRCAHSRSKRFSPRPSRRPAWPMPHPNREVNRMPPSSYWRPGSWPGLVDRVATPAGRWSTFRCWKIQRCWASSAPAERGETASGAFARLEAFVAETLAPELRAEERAAAKGMFGFFLGTAELPDFALAQNPYGAALALAQREPLSIDPARLNRSLEAVSDQDLRRVAREVFAPSRHAGGFVSPQ